MLDLAADLARPEDRRTAARRLAARLGGEDAILFLPDPEVAALLPAPGFPQTLPGGHSWRAFLEATSATGGHQARLPWGAPDRVVPASALAAPDGTVLVVLGCDELRLRPGERHLLHRVLPLAASAIRGEQAARLAAGQRALAQEAGEQARALMDALDETRCRLEAALRQAQQAVELHNEFLAVAAHELKTPVAALLGTVQLAIRRLRHHGALDPEELEQTLHVVADQTVRVGRHVEQLLDVSRLESGTLVIRPRPVDVIRLVAQVVAATQLTTQAHRLHLRAAFGVTAIVDPVRLEQIVRNVLENAVRFSPGGGEIETVIDRPADAMVRITVRDHGLGIAPELRRHIFDRFFQAHRHDFQSGIGLGLYISRQLAVLSGGRMEVDFPDGGGTRVSVVLPAAPDQAAPPGDTSRRPGGQWSLRAKDSRRGRRASNRARPSDRKRPGRRR